MQFLAHYRESDDKEQSVEAHLKEVSIISGSFTGKIGLASIGRLIGLLHDLGKYSHTFQIYLRSAIGQLNPDEDEYIDAKGMKGKIDHSTAGAQYVWQYFRDKSELEWQLIRQILALCIASHHSGLIDCLSPVGKDVFTDRIEKEESRAHYNEVLRKADMSVRKSIGDYLKAEAVESEVRQFLATMSNQTQRIGTFNLGMLTKFLLSALIDADRLNSAYFEDSAVRCLRCGQNKQDWNILIVKLEKHIVAFNQCNNIDKIRANISARCAAFSSREKGLYLLTVPTGGGKTLASLRFALRHAKRHKMERIVYVIPYTSIIDQNAAVVRAILEDEKECGKIVLEHHSNLTPEKDTWQSKILAENWDAPIVYTTAVQFLETLFASGTRGARRLHQLANAIIIFDEVQTLPIKTIHVFNNAINFLVGQCRSTVLFCTATQPILDKVNKDKGAARLAENPEIMPDVKGLFRDLRRVEVLDERKNGGWQEDDIANLTIQELIKNGSVLVIVNTKTAARYIYHKCKEKLTVNATAQVFHLSTNMCPAHRLDILKTIKKCLDPIHPKPIICVSTQLIEAGVDIDFCCVIRYLAGLDSIAQAAGRCNRNGLCQVPGKVFVINPVHENLDKLSDIRIAKEKAERVLDEYKRNPKALDDDLIGPKAMEMFYKYYFFERADEMVYPIGSEQIGRDGDLLSLLSTNDLSVKAYERMHNKNHPAFHLRQSFKSAAESFEAINAPTEGVIVPYGKEGEIIIGELCAAHDVKKQRDLLRRAQRFSVNVFPNILNKLRDNQCVCEVQEGSGILYLDEQYYSSEFGVSLEIVEPMKFSNA